MRIYRFTINYEDGPSDFIIKPSFELAMLRYSEFIPDNIRYIDEYEALLDYSKNNNHWQVRVECLRPTFNGAGDKLERVKL